MTKSYREQITVLGAWRGSDIQEDNGWIMQLDGPDIDEIDRALAHVKSQRLTIPFDRSVFDLPHLKARIGEIPRLLEDGLGFIVVRGVPRERYSNEECTLIYWGIAAHLGTPISQNLRGENICHVRNEGRSLSDPNARGYQTLAKLEFHCDLLPVDILGLFCLRTAKAGGASYLVSALAVHNVILDERPDLLDVLYEPFHGDWRGDRPDGAEPWYTNPLYSYWDGKLTSRVTARFVFDQVARFGDELALTECQSEALDVVHEVASRPDMRLAIDFQEGDIQFVNNHMVLHAREAYEDFDEPERRRHLLRMWIALPPEQRRQLAPELLDRYRLVEAGGINNAAA